MYWLLRVSLGIFFKGYWLLKEFTKLKFLILLIE